jgi:flagellin
MQSEYDALGQELSNVLKNTTFAGTKLLAGATGTDGTIASTAGMTFQIGASSSETMSVNLSGDMASLVSDVSSATSNYAAAGTGTELTSSANATIGSLETALASVGKVRSGLGAAANRLDHVYNNLANISTNSKAATGLIMDVDFATESSNMTSSQMLLQAGTAMLKQTNSMSSMVMSLLQ